MKRNKLIKWIRYFNLWLNKKDSFGHKLSIELRAERNRVKKITHCGYCKFYDCGKCKFNPPIMIKSQYTQNGTYMPQWPSTQQYDWCGQFKEKVQ